MRTYREVDYDLEHDKRKQREADAGDPPLKGCPVCGAEAELVSRVCEPVYVGCKMCYMHTRGTIAPQWAVDEWNEIGGDL